jgi:hypothetical protein
LNVDVPKCRPKHGVTLLGSSFSFVQLSGKLKPYGCSKWMYLPYVYNEKRSKTGNQLLISNAGNPHRNLKMCFFSYTFIKISGVAIFFFTDKVYAS